MKGSGGISMAVVLLLAWQSLASASNRPLSGLALSPRRQEVGTPTPVPSVFVPEVTVTSLAEGTPGLQDVEGAVLDATGNGVVGLRMRVASDGWEAYDATKGGGAFKFTLSTGRFSIRVVDRQSSPAFFSLDGKSKVRVVFREVRSQPVATPTSPSGATPTAIDAPGTPSPTATATKTLGIEVGTPVVLRPTAPAAAPVAPTPMFPKPKRNSLLLSDLFFTSWTGPFFFGLGLGALVFVVAFGLTLLRRLNS